MFSRTLFTSFSVFVLAACAVESEPAPVDANPVTVSPTPQCLPIELVNTSPWGGPCQNSDPAAIGQCMNLCQDDFSQCLLGCASGGYSHVILGYAGGKGGFHIPNPGGSHVVNVALCQNDCVVRRTSCQSGCTR